MPSKLGVREIVLVGLFTGLTCIVAFIMKWGGAVLVPFSLLPLMSFLAGALLGGRLGALSMLVYVLMGIVGIPVFATEPFGGPIYVLKPTFGFLLGFIASAYVTGKIVEKHPEPSIWRYGLGMLAGVGVIYLIGLPYIWVACNFWAGAIMQYLAVSVKAMSMPTVIKVSFLPFIGFDLIKVGFGAFLAHLVTRRVGAVVRRPVG
ncbi:MAG: biotin transporter BioY [Syntrophomonadaceae bacterium]|nr:biotin transporter BioY [Syntrophomonadaceae bacterium]